MDKLFHDAINRYYLLDCQIGRPEFIMFNFYHGEKEHQKVYVRSLLQGFKKDKQVNFGLKNIEELISVDIVHPD